MHTPFTTRQPLPAGLVAMFLGAAALSHVEVSAAPSPSRSPSPAPRPAPAPRPSPAPAPRPAPAPTKVAPTPAPKPAPSFAGQSPAYKSVTMNAPAAMPSPRNASRPSPTTSGKPGASKVQGPKVEMRAPEQPKIGSGAPTVARPAQAKPSLETAGLANGVSSRLAPRVRQFEDRYRNVQVVKQPTTSGWTWLFLAWALYNSGENSRLESDNAAIKARMSELEKQLRDDPAEWSQLQELAAQPPVPDLPAATPTAAASDAPPSTNTGLTHGNSAGDVPSPIATETAVVTPNWWALVAVLVTGAACGYTLLLGRK